MGKTTTKNRPQQQIPFPEVPPLDDLPEDEGEAPIDRADEPRTAGEALDAFNKSVGYVDPFANPGAQALDPDEEFDFNVSDSVGGGFLGVGVFDCRVIGIQRGDPSRNGDPCLVWEYEVVRGESKGKTTRQWTYTGKAGWKLLEVKEALGLSPDQVFKRADVLHKAVTIATEESEYQGKRRVNVQTVIAPRWCAIGTVIDDAALAALDQPPF